MSLNNGFASVNSHDGKSVVVMSDPRFASSSSSATTAMSEERAARRNTKALQDVLFFDTSTGNQHISIILNESVYGFVNQFSKSP